jgi:hypothetical protein
VVCSRPWGRGQGHRETDIDKHTRIDRKRQENRDTVLVGNYSSSSSVLCVRLT